MHYFRSLGWRWGPRLAGVLLLAALWLGYSLGSDPPPGPTRRQQRQLRSQLAVRLRQVAADTLRAAQAAAHGRTHYATGQVAARQAQVWRLRTHQHPHRHVLPSPATTPAPAPDTGVYRLQRLLSAY